MATTEAFDYFDDDPARQERAAALTLAVEILQHAVPRPQVQKVEYPHEVTGLARFILTGEDVFNQKDDD